MNKNPLIIIFITVFIDLIGFGMIIPLSPYLAQKYGASALEVGLLMSIYSAFQFLMAPVWGQISDKIGRRPVILMSLFVAGSSHILFGLADSLALLFLARALAGIGGANISTAMAYISDVTESKDRSKGMGLIGAAFGLGFVLGPALGGFFGQISFSAPAFVAGGICLVNFVWAYFFLPESKNKSSVSQVKTNRLQRILKHFKVPSVGPLMLVSFVLSLSLANVEACLFLLVSDRFEWSLSQASYGFAFLGLLMAFTQGYLIRKLLPKFGERKLIVLGALFFAFALVLTGYSHSLYLTAVAMVFLALGTGFYNPSLLGLVSINSDQEQQGEVLGVMQSLSALARILGPALGGWLYQAYGTGVPFYFGGLISAASVFFIYNYFNKTKAKSGAKSDQNLEEDGLLKIERFQLENIVNNSVPYRLFYIGQRLELSTEVLGHPLMQKIEFIEPSQGCAALQKILTDQQYPVILLSASIPAAKQWADQLEAEGYLNVYYYGDVVSELALR